MLDTSLSIDDKFTRDGIKKSRGTCVARDFRSEVMIKVVVRHREVRYSSRYSSCFHRQEVDSRQEYVYFA